MELQSAIQQLESSLIFKNWKSSNKDFFLAHAFVMFDEANADVWQLGFFNEKNNLMTTFIIDKNEIKIIPDQEILKSDNSIVPLNVAGVRISSLQALHSAQLILKKNYSAESPLKVFFILQQIKNVAVYNITFLTKSFKTLNIKISAVDGSVIHSSLSALANF
ncbi:hypothetical protein HY484_04200 [Candidatus Woesearchaeota archaeon]|nr:hypothetical protein [Candidatus Woesearchaeota archaeon]